MKDKDMKWRTLSSHYLSKRPWMTARVDKVELPTGVILDEYYVLEYPDWVNTIAITKDGKFVFVRQYRYAIGRLLMNCVLVYARKVKTLWIVPSENCLKRQDSVVANGNTGWIYQPIQVLIPT